MVTALADIFLCAQCRSRYTSPKKDNLANPADFDMDSVLDSCDLANFMVLFHL